MPINFPADPEVGDIYTYNNRSWTWSGEVWTPNRAQYTANRDITGPRPGVAFVPIDTHSAKSIMGDMSLPMYKEFHEALCEYRLESLKR